ncbi:uncharacterized protein DFL_003229 [Arthrobotrys flagrans]|uniref:Uncharacterized protein n=1 Tax=Arthrobotrys flagrans TaxID=97331 RepID=A0A437A199_ARTFL|nr:hypothetical protein DFL_003229 [Arthrobotrys flagrans]
MQLSKLAYLLPLIATVLAAAVPDTNSGVSMVNDEIEVSELEGNIFDKRACSSNKCKCAEGTKAGVYCGRCGAVTSLGSGGINDVYQCASSGECCRYGPRSSCAGSSYTPCG